MERRKFLIALFGVLSVPASLVFANGQGKSHGKRHRNHPHCHARKKIPLEEIKAIFPQHLNRLRDEFLVFFEHVLLL